MHIFCTKHLCLLLKSEMIFSVNEDILIVLKHYEILLAESCSTFAHIRAGTHIHDNLLSTRLQVNVA